MRDLVPFVQFKKCEKNHGRVLLLVKWQASVAGSNFPMSALHVFYIVKMVANRANHLTSYCEWLKHYTQDIVTEGKKFWNLKSKQKTLIQLYELWKSKYLEMYLDTTTGNARQ